MQHCHLQTTDDARQFLRIIDPSLGRPLGEKNYATDCRVYTPDHPDGPFAIVMEKMDVFVPCHFLGWWIKVRYCVCDSYLVIEAVTIKR